MVEILTAVLIVMGCMFCLIAAIGMLRLPDTLIRMHAATKAGTLGTGLVLASVAVWYGDVGVVLKAFLGLIFLFLTAPVAAHLIGRAAYRSSIALSSATWIDQLADDRKEMQNSEKGADHL